MYEPFPKIPRFLYMLIRYFVLDKLGSHYLGPKAHLCSDANPIQGVIYLMRYKCLFSRNLMFLSVYTLRNNKPEAVE